jgi:hypothetical protein
MQSADSMLRCFLSCLRFLLVDFLHVPPSAARSCQETGGRVISKARPVNQNDCKVRGSFPEVGVSVKVVHTNWYRAVSWNIDLLKPICYVMHQQVRHSTTKFCPHCICFVFIWEQTAACATYSINWLVFITEMKSVYCAVRTGALNKAVCAASLKG